MSLKAAAQAHGQALRQAGADFSRLPSAGGGFTVHRECGCPHRAVARKKDLSWETRYSWAA